MLTYFVPYFLLISTSSGHFFHNYPPDKCDLIDSSVDFDFIVVGAGTAGSIVASRLTEIYPWRVLLLEAGTNPNPLWSVPSLMSMPDDDISWRYKYAPAPDQCLAMKNGQCDLHLPLVLGGASVTNALVFNRGNRNTYNHWAELGCDGWSYAEVLPYFLKIENYEAYPITDMQTNFSVSSMFHRLGGPVDINLFPPDPFTERVRRSFIAASNELGTKSNIDFNGMSSTGVTRSVGHIDSNHFRVNTAKAYLRDRPNLVICKRSLVTRVLFNDRNTAIGVEYIRDGIKRQNYVTKEVILSAGAIGTPALLERSGVGQPSVIEGLGVPLVTDLPGVGENLQDPFLLIGMAYSLDSKSYSRPNPFSLNIIDLSSFINTESFKKDDADLLIQPFAFPKGKGSSSFASFGKKLNLIDPIIEAYVEAASRRDLFMISPVALRPESRGSVHSISLNPFDRLEIIGNHFTEPSEIETMLKGVRYVQDIFQTEIMSKYRPDLVRIPICEEFIFDSDEYWVCMIKNTASTLYSPVGTCKMGSQSDPSAVLSPDLTVNGVEGLRVIDASVMPLYPRGHAIAPVMMIAEYGSDLIKNYYGV